jgi:membrane fusion protein (multidrug efflux system)
VLTAAVLLPLLAGPAIAAPASAPPTAPLTAVVVAPVVVQNVAPSTKYTGRVQAIQSVDFIARVQAFVEKIDFAEGGLVTAGQTLFELQKAPYKATLDGAQAALAKAEATEKNALLTVERDTQLVRRNDVSESVLDSDTATQDGALADILSARANAETAAINLSYTTILTPIAGRIGKSTFTVGNLVGPTIGSLATVVQVDPIRVVFSVADSDVVSALSKSKDTQAQLNASVALSLELSDGQAYAEPGRVEFIDNQVDSATGTVAVWGLFPNPQGLLIPGGFATVSVRAAKPLSLPTVSVQAVQDDAAGAFVLLVDKDGTVRQQPVTRGAQIGQNWVITAGLTGGENVIVQGFQKVKAGQHVNAVQQSSLASADATAVAGR